MKKIYFDNNIVIKLANKDCSLLSESIEYLNKNKALIVFSPAHIEEIANGGSKHGHDSKVIQKKLEFLDKLTKSTALLPFKIDEINQKSDNGVYISSESTFATFKRVVTHYENNKFAESNQKEMLEFAEEVQKNTATSPIQINNKDMKIELEKNRSNFFREIIRIYREEKIFYSYAVKNIIPMCPPRTDQLNFVHLKYFYPLHEIMIELAMRFLEKSRFYPDSSKNNISNLHDVTHTIYAAYCDVFVTDDKKLSQKASVVYEWYGVKTLVLSSKDYIEWVKDNI